MFTTIKLTLFELVSFKVFKKKSKNFLQTIVDKILFCFFFDKIK